MDRNRAIQVCVDEIKDRRFPIWGSLEDWTPYFMHWLNIYRVREEQGDEGDPQYNWRWVWKRKGPDHLALATIYARVALDKYGESLAEIVGDNQPFPTAGRQPTVPQKYRGPYDKVNL